MEIADSYDWLRDHGWPNVTDPKVLDFLQSGNAEYYKFLASNKEEEDAIFQEIKGRTPEEDQTVPVKIDDYYYYSYLKKGCDYRIHARRCGSLDAEEEVLLDENKEALNYNFYKIESFEVSPDHNYLLYSVDTSGKERYTVKVIHLNKDGEGNHILIDSFVDNVHGDIVWNKAGTGFFYASMNESWRSKDIYFHKVSTEKSSDILMYHEEDDTFSVRVYKSSSDKFLFIESKSGTNNEIRYIESNTDSFFDLKLIKPREEGHIYRITNHKDSFYILTNDKGENFRLVIAPVSDPHYDNWREVVPYSKDIYLMHALAYEDNLVISKKESGLPKIDILNISNNRLHPIFFKEPSYDVKVAFTTYDAPSLRYKYSSLNQPESVFEIDFQTFEVILLKTANIPSGFNPEEYTVERLWVPSNDGVKIPLSLIYNNNLFAGNGSNPLYLYGYGSYGHSVVPAFKSGYISLIDRGFVFAIAHIRGGDDLGRDWYESAKFLNKKKTFEDFICCSEYLIENCYTSAGNIVISGGSAGGMLVGYCINNSPELYKAAIMNVPFVDVLNTMLDEMLPLTPGEFKEWGNPKNKEYYDYIKSYSPYDNIRPQAYPHIFLTAGLSDPRVTYWEPAKFYAKLIDMRTDDGFTLLKTNMEAGHAGKTGKLQPMRDLAEQFSFILKVFGETPPMKQDL
jgi:oligopeptidase B